jgi:hypothetical protein
VDASVRTPGKLAGATIAADQTERTIQFPLDRALLPLRLRAIEVSPIVGKRQSEMWHEMGRSQQILDVDELN